MVVDRKWVQRNLGFDPRDTPPSRTTFNVSSVATAHLRRAPEVPTSEDFQREIIDFDSESPTGQQFLALSTATGLSRYTEIDWPRGLALTTSVKGIGVVSRDIRFLRCRYVEQLL